MNLKTLGRNTVGHLLTALAISAVGLLILDSAQAKPKNSTEDLTLQTTKEDFLSGISGTNCWDVSNPYDGLSGCCIVNDPAFADGTEPICDWSNVQDYCESAFGDPLDCSDPDVATIYEDLSTNGYTLQACSQTQCQPTCDYVREQAGLPVTNEAGAVAMYWDADERNPTFGECVCNWSIDPAGSRTDPANCRFPPEPIDCSSYGNWLQYDITENAPDGACFCYDDRTTPLDTEDVYNHMTDCNFICETMSYGDWGFWHSAQGRCQPCDLNYYSPSDDVFDGCEDWFDSSSYSVGGGGGGTGATTYYEPLGCIGGEAAVDDWGMTYCCTGCSSGVCAKDNCTLAPAMR